MSGTRGCLAAWTTVLAVAAFALVAAAADAMPVDSVLAPAREVDAGRETDDPDKDKDKEHGAGKPENAGSGHGGKGHGKPDDDDEGDEGDEGDADDEERPAPAAAPAPVLPPPAPVLPPPAPGVPASPVTPPGAPENGGAGVPVGVLPGPQPFGLIPRSRSVVSRPPVLAWPVDRLASYYNVQLFRGGRKIRSTWPRRPSLVLTRTWRYHGRTRRLTAGTYTWYVWPGYGARSEARYGTLIGRATFRVRPRRAAS